MYYKSPNQNERRTHKAIGFVNGMGTFILPWGKTTFNGRVRSKKMTKRIFALVMALTMLASMFSVSYAMDADVSEEIGNQIDPESVAVEFNYELSEPYDVYPDLNELNETNSGITLPLSETPLSRPITPPRLRESLLDASGYQLGEDAFVARSGKSSKAVTRSGAYNVNPDTAYGYFMLTSATDFTQFHTVATKAGHMTAGMRTNGATNMSYGIQVAVFDSNSNLKFTDSNIMPGAFNMGNQLRFSVSAGDYIILQVECTGSYDPGSTYLIGLMQQTSIAPDRFEINDSFLHNLYRGTMMRDDYAQISANIDNQLDTDWYIFDFGTTRSERPAFRLNSSKNLVMHIFTLSGSSLNYLGAMSSSDGLTTMPATSSGSVTYYVAVQSLNGAGTYTLEYVKLRGLITSIGISVGAVTTQETLNGNPLIKDNFSIAFYTRDQFNEVVPQVQVLVDLYKENTRDGRNVRIWSNQGTYVTNDNGYGYESATWGGGEWTFCNYSTSKAGRTYWYDNGRIEIKPIGLPSSISAFPIGTKSVCFYGGSN